MKRIAVILAVVGLFATAGVVLAQSSGSFELPWQVIAAGGERSASSSYQVAGTIGQAAGSPPRLVSAGFRVGSGYWAGIRATLAEVRYSIYLPLVQRESN